MSPTAQPNLFLRKLLVIKTRHHAAEKQRVAHLIDAHFTQRRNRALGQRGLRQCPQIVCLLLGFRSKCHKPPSLSGYCAKDHCSRLGNEMSMATRKTHAADKSRQHKDLREAGNSEAGLAKG